MFHSCSYPSLYSGLSQVSSFLMLMYKSCYSICLACAHSREYWLSRTAKSGRWEMGKKKRNERKNASFLSKTFVRVYHRKPIPTNVSNALVIKEARRVFVPLNKQSSGKAPPRPRHTYFLIWVKVRGYFEGARKNAQLSQASSIFFCLIQKISHLSVFLSPPRFIYLLYNKRYNS